MNFGEQINESTKCDQMNAADSPEVTTGFPIDDLRKITKLHSG
jgi:hypothetical protein